MEDRIEHRIAVRAPLDRVWSLVTRPGWWLTGSRTDPAQGAGRVAVEWSGERRPWVVDVIRLEPQGYVSFRWAGAFGGAVPVQGNSTLVELYLRPAGAAGGGGAAGVAGEVSVTVVESGFAALDLPEALRGDQLTAASGGWQFELAGLRMRAEQPEQPSPAGAAPHAPRDLPGAVLVQQATPGDPRSEHMEQAVQTGR